jgi:hypothetical protein
MSIGGGVTVHGGRATLTAGGAWWLEGDVAAANCIAAYTPKGKASLVLSYNNDAAPGNGLADGTYDAAPGTAPTFDATGWTFNGSNQYLDTGYSPGVTSGSSMIVRFSGVLAASFGAVMGALNYGASSGWGIQPWRPATTVVNYVNGTSTRQVSPQVESGVLAIAGMQAYRNGVADGASWTYGAWVSYHSIYVGMWRGYSGLYYRACSVQAAALYDVVLNAAQVSAISAAMAAL